MTADSVIDVEPLEPTDELVREISRRMRRDLGLAFEEYNEVADVQAGAVALVYPRNEDDAPLVLLQRGLDNATTIRVMQHADEILAKLAAGRSVPGESYDSVRNRPAFVVVWRE